MRAPHPPIYHHRGTNQAKSKLKKTISQNNVSRSFTAISGCVCSYLHKYRLYNIFFLKTNERIGFLIPENIRIDIFFISLAYVVVKLCVNMFFLYTLAAILDFAILGLFSTYKKMQSLFFLIFMIFWVKIKWKINLTDQSHESVICDIWAYINSATIFQIDNSRILDEKSQNHKFAKILTREN